MPQTSALLRLNRRQQLWLVLLVAARVGCSLVFACAVPFAAFGAVAALTLSRRDALLFVAAVWLANQAVGFAFLGYPWTANCIAWGGALGLVALLSTLAAHEGTSRFRFAGPLAGWSMVFLIAFIVYEGALFLIAATPLGGSEDFTADIVSRIFAINALGFVGLLVLNRLGAEIGVAFRTVPFAMARRQA